MKTRIGITTGDPAGIGPEISLKAAFDLEVQSLCVPVLIGDGEILRRTAKEIGKHELYSPTGAAEKDLMKFDGFFIRDCRKSALGAPQGKASPEGGRAAAEFIRIGATSAMEKNIRALVTAPICKESLWMAGITHAGHTEFLATLAGVTNVAMLFSSDPLKVALLTTHLSLKEAIRHVQKEEIVSKVQLISEEFAKLFRQTPRIALCALNPHSGEAGMFGDEEKEEIIPAVDALRRSKIDVSGPFPSDTIFLRAIKGEFDLVVAHYHDQALIAVKSLDLKAVNVTLGLPFVRTSPDHGTAFDIAGKNLADPSSMIEAIKVAVSLSSHL